ncbi:RING finger protein 34 [Bulinus truncatus]|nr:RING finger protein 34 [Bulinus truncatus]
MNFRTYFGEGQATQSVSKNVENVPLQSTEAPPLSLLEIPSLDNVGDTTNTDSAFVARNSENIATTNNKQPDDSLCHICMDSLVDCILLECGHMVTCTQCGKRLADCPICRQYIARVVRVFRS